MCWLLSDYLIEHINYNPGLARHLMSTPSHRGAHGYRFPFCKAEGTNKLWLHSSFPLIISCLSMSFITASYVQRLNTSKHNRLCRAKLHVSPFEEYKILPSQNYLDLIHEVILWVWVVPILNHYKYSWALVVISILRLFSIDNLLTLHDNLKSILTPKSMTDCGNLNINIQLWIFWKWILNMQNETR